jgi:hypothetical protein
MTLITYRRRAVALAGPGRFYLAPHIAQRPNGDPLKRFVCFLALYARDVLTGQLPGDPHRYVPQRGERYAREKLIPPREFAAIAHQSDEELAERFGVPLEQIAHRRADLADELLPSPRQCHRRSRWRRRPREGSRLAVKRRSR